MPRLTTFAAAATASLVLAGSAQAAEPTSYFFACTGGSKVQNNQPPSWTTTAPATSFTGGAGCGSADVGLLRGDVAGQRVDFLGAGEHTGPIQAINVELHSLLVSQARLRPDPGMRAELTIDGDTLFLNEEAFRVTPVVSATGLTEKYEFSFTRKKDPKTGLTPPLVAGDGKHEVSLRVTPFFLDYQHIWVWGASEVPSRVEIDPVKLVSPKLVVG